MNETNFESQEIKPKVSKLAIASFLIPCISIVGSFCSIFIIKHNWVNPHPRFQFLFFMPIFNLSFIFALLLLSLSFISFILGIAAIITIKGRRGSQKGYIYAILGILISLLAFINSVWALGCIKPEATMRMCQKNMIELYKTIATYSKTDNQYPAKDKWCDLLTDQPKIEKGIFLCPGPDRLKSNRWNREQPYRCSYAINPNAEPNSAGDVVLLFETKDGWNQSGEAELMSFDNHYRKGCNVLFNDGHVEFVSPKKKDKLNWGNKKNTK
jgi:prepilin-type processing-associated H-X9-DG protein